MSHVNCNYKHVELATSLQQITLNNDIAAITVAIQLLRLYYCIVVQQHQQPTIDIKCTMGSIIC